MTAKLLALSVLPAIVHAFSNTVPVAVWTSHTDLSFIQEANSASSLVNNLVSEPTICDHEAVVFIDHPGLYASDLRTLSSSSSIVQSIQSSHSSKQFPYLSDDQSPLDVSAAAQSLANRCGSRLVQFAPGMGGVSLEKGSKHVVCMTMPHMHADHPNGRQGTVHEHDSLLSSELSAISATFPKHLVIFAGTSAPSSFLRRQAADGDHPTRPAIQDAPTETEMMSIPEIDDPNYTPGPRPTLLSFSSGRKVYNYAEGNSTVPKNAGILKKYQILTPGLILTLLITFGLLLPGILVGFNALAAIQSPLRLDAPKAFDASSRKNQ